MTSPWSDPKVLHEMASLPPAEGPSHEAYARAKERADVLRRAVSRIEEARPEATIYIKIIRALIPIIEEVLVHDIGDENDCNVQYTRQMLSALNLMHGCMIGMHQNEEVQRLLIKYTVENLTDAINHNPAIEGVIHAKSHKLRWWHRFWKPKTWTERSE